MAKELDNMKMWESLIKHSKVSWITTMLKKALKDQSFEYKDGEIVSIKTDPCDGCKIASGGCTLTCRKWKEYYKTGVPETDFGKKEELTKIKDSESELSHSELTEYEEEIKGLLYDAGNKYNLDADLDSAAKDLAPRFLKAARKQFAEEAYKYLEANLYDEVCYDCIRPDIVSHFIEDFKKALEKGE